jgi:sterol desaturase/sphingolipid hydroxylase (fatty acid hydroxylase superfamily)
MFEAFSSWDRFTSALLSIPRTFVKANSGMAWPYLITSLLVAYGVYLFSKRHMGTRISFREFVFPARIYRHPSAILDYRFYGVNLLITALFLIPMGTGIAALGYKAASVVSAWLPWAPPPTMSSWSLVAAGFVLFLLTDFTDYYTHCMFHRIPILWSFHAVHHAAEVLNPITARRFHPLEYIVTAVFQAPIVGIAAFAFQGLSVHDQEITMIFGASIFMVVFAVSGRHLRHSHIWLSYGSAISHVVISPAQHQIHHSTDPRHVDKNYGDKLAVWDALCGTLYVPKERETLQVGLPGSEHGEFATVGQCYVSPVRKVFELSIESIRRRLHVGSSRTESKAVG